MNNKAKQDRCKRSQSRRSLKKKLIDSGQLKEICSVCGQNNIWLGIPLVMVLDHINGVNDDNRMENLRLICPNCNSQLPTFAGRNARKGKNVKCLNCNKEFWKVPSSKREYCCHSCNRAATAVKKVNLTEEQIWELVKEFGYAETGRKLGVSPTSIRRYVIRLIKHNDTK